MDREEEQLYWMDKAKKYVTQSMAESSVKWKEQWMADALFAAYLRGVEDAKEMRIIT